MSKAQLTIVRVNVADDGTMSTDASKSFTAMLNPSDIKLDRSIQYNTRPTLGQRGNEAKFSRVQPDKLSFSLLLDATGAVPANEGSSGVKPVPELIKALDDLVYEYIGEKHQPGQVCVIWGTLMFYGRLSSMQTQYTLFAPGGTPLRAKVDLGFVGFLTKKQAELMSNRSSPDLTHRVEVRRGDTLPLLCWRIYGDCAYYVDVARHNRLANFRRLVPGTLLHFPPLE